MKIAVFGGSFNPLHLGHAMLADVIIKELGFDKVLFVPAYMPPHKTMNNNSATDRLQMLKDFCASEGDGHFEAESCEIERGGISYTCDTMEYLSEKYKDVLEGKFFLVMGDEVAADFHKWKNPEKIAEYADFIITRRYPDVAAFERLQKKLAAAEGNCTENKKNEGFENVPSGTYKKDFEVKFSREKFGYPCIYLENPVLPVSSTEIRQKISEGKSFKYLVPSSVYEYIKNHNLYK